MRRFALSFTALAAVPLVHAQAPAGTADEDAVAVVRASAEWFHRGYAECERRARVLDDAIAVLIRSPCDDSLAAARAAWIAARLAYGPTEVARFSDGPIEPIEPLLNSWPLDEAYIDYVVGQPDAGIVHDVAGYPRIAESVLVLANERGGEANVSLGWHAIEFLLWGQDLRADGPGDRPATDYDPRHDAFAVRRGQYLAAASALVVRQMAELRRAWEPRTGAYRRRFEADLPGAVRRMLVGVTVLTVFELAGERLGVAYLTQDQEQEHSCFSDTSCADLVANQLGVRRVVAGGADGASPGLAALVDRLDPALARELVLAVDETLTLLRAIPAPLDRAMLGEDDAPGRVAIRAALDALDRQAELLAIAGRSLGFELPTRPGGF